MNRPLQYILFSVIILALIFLSPACKSRAGHNEYLEAKHRVSEIEMKKNKKILKKGSKAYKKQMRHNRKFLFGRSKAPKS
ncbi:MAG: hypothetical protein K0Q95_948 [Bacteroidota bacterium]|jgi:hypothetical protein|nr:hypothetical protein [Bacteroidota bacterium]